jgi:radical SAM protein with 4Fe4S-binding SPASM domain
MPWRNLRRFLSKGLKQPLYAVRVTGRRAQAYVSYYLRKGRASLPEAITLFLTYHCNLRCKMCGQWGETGVTKKHSSRNSEGELSLQEMNKIIDDISLFKPNITLFGGEPLLHRHALDVIRHIKNKGMHCLMITNGSMLKGMAEEVVDAGLDELNVSIDGGRELHDEIRGMPGLFDRVISGLKQVSRIKTEKNRKKPLINLQCTITRYNYEHLEQMVDVAQEIRTDSLTFHNLIFISKDLIEKQREFDEALHCSSASWEGFVFEPRIEPDVLYAKIKEIMNVRHGFPVDFYPHFSLEELKAYYQTPSYQPKGFSSGCVSPWMVAYIFPDGELRPCLNFDYSFGNVRENRFSELWNNERAREFRRTLKGKGVFPVCVRCTELYRY